MEKRPPCGLSLFTSRDRFGFLELLRVLLPLAAAEQQGVATE